LSNDVGYPQPQQTTASLQSYPVQPPGSQPIQHIPPTQHMPPPASYPSQQLPYPASMPIQQPSDQSAELQSAPPDYAAGNSINSYTSGSGISGSSSSNMCFAADGPLEPTA